SIAGSMKAALSAVVWRARRRVRCIVRILYVSRGAAVAPPFGPERGLIQRASGSREAAVRRALDPCSGLGREQHRDRREDREDDPVGREQHEGGVAQVCGGGSLAAVVVGHGGGEGDAGR